MTVLNIRVEGADSMEIAVLHRMVQEMAARIDGRVYYAPDGYVIRGHRERAQESQEKSE